MVMKNNNTRGRKSGQRKPDRKRGNSKASPARLLALDVLLEVSRRDAFVRDIFEAQASGRKLDKSDKAFAMRLALGVVQMRGVLDEIIDAVLSSPDDIKPDVREALRISVYEIIFLEKDAYAGVDQGVELVKSIVPPAAGLANAVLRKVVKVKDAFPFGDPKKDIDAYSRLRGFPSWLAAYTLKTLGPAEGDAFIQASNEPAPLFVSAVAPRVADEEVRELIARINKDDHASYTESEYGCFRIDDPAKIADGRVRQALGQGRIVVADAASQAIANLCAEYSDGSSFLEIGAGRGTKTILIQSDYFRVHGAQIEKYVTLDNAVFKTKLTEERTRELGIDVVQTICADATDLASVLANERFQCVFIDAPCSGLGTLRRHPEIRWRITPSDIEACAELDHALLSEAARYVCAGGYLIYATCTITSAENEEAIARFLSTECGRTFNPVRAFRSTLHVDGPDAHFCTVMQKMS